MTDVNFGGKLMSKTKRFNPGPPPYNGLTTIKRYLIEGKYFIDGKARDGASRSFAWNSEEIKQALLKLQKKHFHKKDIHWEKPKAVVDYYKAWGLMGENVYTHFHIDPDDDILIIDSFKRI